MGAAPHDEAEIARAMARLRKALTARIRRDEQAERRAARRTLPPRDLADYDLAAMAQLLRPRLERDGRGWRVVAAEIGVTAPDLSRVMAGQQIAAGKVFAICDWAKVDPRRFYRAPRAAKAARSTGNALKQRSKPRDAR